MTFMLPAENKTGTPNTARETFEQLLNDMIESSDGADRIAARIDALFGQERAIMVLDMSGFSRVTHSHGILVFLGMIRRMQRLAREPIQSYGGQLIKAEADNLYCLFDTTFDAVRAATGINDRLAAFNTESAEDRRLYVSAGIGYGRILNIGDEDIFGGEVNIASKLGEDVAGRGEILLTPSAGANLDSAYVRTTRMRVEIAGLDLCCHRIEGLGEG